VDKIWKWAGGCEAKRAADVNNRREGVIRIEGTKQQEPKQNNSYAIDRREESSRKIEIQRESIHLWQ
jgi:hypothetical protein